MKSVNPTNVPDAMESANTVTEAGGPQSSWFSLHAVPALAQLDTAIGISLINLKRTEMEFMMEEKRMECTMRIEQMQLEADCERVRFEPERLRAEAERLKAEACLEANRGSNRLCGAKRSLNMNDACLPENRDVCLTPKRPPSTGYSVPYHPVDPIHSGSEGLNTEVPHSADTMAMYEPTTGDDRETTSETGMRTTKARIIAPQIISKKTKLGGAPNEMLQRGVNLSLKALSSNVSGNQRSGGAVVLNPNRKDGSAYLLPEQDSEGLVWCNQKV